MKKILQNISGFSLIELLVAIVVIGIILSLAMQSMDTVVDDNRRVTTNKEMDKLAQAIVGNPDIANTGVRSDFGFVGDNGAFPSSLQELYSNTNGWSTWDGPYITTGIAQDTVGLKYDEWNQPYNYTGGITITSTGSGPTITKKIADAPSDYLLNSFNGVIKDSQDSLPGLIYKDSIEIEITIPNGGGSLVTKIYNPASDGNFTLDSLPVGQHQMEIIYSPENDTLTRYLTILPRHKSNAVTFNFGSSYFSTGGGGGGGTGIETLRPVGPGSQTQLNNSGCTNNWECTNEAVNNGDAGYVYRTENNYRIDLYEMENHTVGSGTIDSVIVYISCMETNSSGRVQTRIRTNSRNYNGVLENPGSGSYNDYSTTYINNPRTNSLWTWSEIDDLQAGTRLRRARCTQVWVDVFYTY